MGTLDRGIYIEQVKELAQVARKQALATTDKAVKDKEETVDTKEQAIAISKDPKPTPAGTNGNKTPTPPKSKLAAMLEQLRE